MNKLLHLLLPTLCLAVASFSVAADPVWSEIEGIADIGDEAIATDEDDIFAGKLNLGYLASTGNTESSSFVGKLTLAWDLEKWRHAAVASGFSSETDGVTDGEQYRAGYKADRKLGDKNYLFGVVNWENDRFSGIDRRTSEAVGFGRRFLETGSHTLDLELGVGARQTKRTTGEETDETISRFAGNYAWQIAENSTFKQGVAVESGDENTYIESTTELTAQLIGQLDLSISYVIKRNSVVPLDSEKTDTYTSVSVVYSF
ncbi:MAG: DUF481 domain-containing protein [Gammaproteobacteria bacterium]|nr:DUF481 domain-containing protein [Gammaproteobacteria bacterium]